MSYDPPRPTFSKGWFQYHDDEIAVAREAILNASSIGPEDHLKDGKASPVVDKALLIGVLADLVADLSRRLALTEKRVEWMKATLERLTHDDTPQPDPADD